MLMKLANILDQLDLASEHMGKPDLSDSRFALMLTDNVVELMLHQIAKDKKSEIMAWRHLRDNYNNLPALENALKRHFGAKIKFARDENKISEEQAKTFSIMHDFRNEVYHIGISHERILPTIAKFYLDVAGRWLATYDPLYMGWMSGQKLPTRAMKYFSEALFFSGSTDQYRTACLRLAESAGHDPASVGPELAAHMSEVIEDTDRSIDIIANDGPNKTTRVQAIIDCQAWPLAFTPEGEKFLKDSKWKGDNPFQAVEWIAQNYPLKFRLDPIRTWNGRAQRLQRERNPHAALEKYRGFMDQTSDLREHLDEAAAHVEAWVDSEIDRRRGK